MFTSISGYSVVVTGGTKGIGKGIARVFAKAGANVLITGRDEASAKAACAELTRLGGGTVTYLLAEVSSKSDCDRVAATAIERNGGIDVLCANAGIFPDSKLATMSEADMDLVFGTNVKGTMLSVQACLPALEKSGHGRIVLTSSITGPVTGITVQAKQRNLVLCELLQLNWRQKESRSMQYCQEILQLKV